MNHLTERPVSFRFKIDMEWDLWRLDERVSPTVRIRFNARVPPLVILQIKDVMRRVLREATL